MQSGGRVWRISCRQERLAYLKSATYRARRHPIEEDRTLVASDRPGRGFLATGCIALIVIFIPVLGHIVLTVMILSDDLTPSEKLLWLIVVWVFWFIGPFLYLLLGQRRDRLFGERPAM